MLDSEISDMARTMIEVQFEDRRRELAREIEFVHNKMAMRGLGRSGPVLSQVSALCVQEVETRGLIVWQVFQRILSRAEVPRQEGLAQYLKAEVEAYLGLVLDELNRILARNVVREGQQVPSLNDARDRALRKIGAEIDFFFLSDPDRKWMELATSLSPNSRDEDGNPHPRVAVVVVRDGDLLATAFRGETGEGHHAEYGALEQKLKDVIVSGATVYTTLEPCTTRRHPKVPCADRLIERKIARVVIGMVDPDPRITGRGIRRLRAANIPAQLFPADLMSIIEELNRDFIRACNQGSATGQSGSSAVFQRRERVSLESQEVDDLQEMLNSRFSDARAEGFSQLETLAYSKKVEDCPQLLEMLGRTIANHNIEDKLSAIRVFFPILAYTDTETKQTLVQRYITGFLRLLDVHISTELRHEAIRIAQLIPDAGIVSRLILILHNEPEEDYRRQSPHPVFRSLKAMEGMRKEILSRLRREAASTLSSVARQRLLGCMDYIERV